MERRTHPRFDSDIRARILINKMQNASATVLDLSASGLRFHYNGLVDIGDEIVAHLEGGARLEGKVIRKFDYGFAINLELSENKRRRLAYSLEKAKAEGEAMSRLTMEKRFTSRVASIKRTVLCETEDHKFSAEIVDMSLAGVAIKTDAKLEIDSLICVGRMRGYVVRREENFYGIKFLSAEGALAETANLSGQPKKKVRRA